MAPRKRTTKPRKNNPKAAKLEAFLQDFNSEVETRVRQMRENLNQLLNNVDSTYNLALFKMTKPVRQTNWLDLFKSEKPKTPEVDDVKQREEEDAVISSAGADDHALLQKTVSKLRSKKKAETKSTSDDENVPSSSRKGRTSRKPQSTRTTTKTSRKASRQSNRKPLITPARTMLDSSLMMGSTPLITPRFDPRLPKTPAVRVPRHKERVYSISVNGSPVAAGSEDVVLSVPIGNGQSIQLLASQMDSVDLSQLDQTALRSIQLLQNRLTSLCGTSD